MVYVYRNELGEVKYTRDERVVAMIPATLEEDGELSVITLERMIPEPNVEGYTAILKADFKTGRVYYELELSLGKAKSDMVKIAKDWAEKAYNLNTPEGVIRFWIDSKTRATILNSLLSEQKAGKKLTTLVIHEKSMEFPIEAAIEMIYQMDEWDKKVYEVEARHLWNIVSLNTIEEVKSYNYRTDYPAEPWGSLIGLQTKYQERQSRGSLNLLLEFTSQLINLYTLDEASLKRFKYLYPSFEDSIGKSVKQGYIFKYDSLQRGTQLYRTTKDLTITKEVIPDMEDQTDYELLMID